MATEIRGPLDEDAAAIAADMATAMSAHTTWQKAADRRGIEHNAGVLDGGTPVTLPGHGPQNAAAAMEPQPAMPRESMASVNSNPSPHQVIAGCAQ